MLLMLLLMIMLVMVVVVMVVVVGRRRRRRRRRRGCSCSSCGISFPDSQYQDVLQVFSVKDGAHIQVFGTVRGPACGQVCAR